jgi:hypothetical protein
MTERGEGKEVCGKRSMEIKQIPRVAAVGVRIVNCPSQGYH